MAIKATLQSAFRRGWDVLPRAARIPLLKAMLSTVTEGEKFALGFPTVRGLLENVRAAGFSPRTVVDVGANVGNWSRMSASVFPLASYHMFDANPDNAVHLEQTRTQLGAKTSYTITLLGPDERSEVTFYKLGTGSSVLPELTSFGKTPVTLPMCTLDHVLDSHLIETPVLLKLDVQGFELEVLRGASQLLAQAEVVILETSLLPYNEGSPLFSDVVAFMAEHDFVTFDVCGQSRRETDRALYQVDIAFVKRDSALRAPRKFWLREP